MPANLVEGQTTPVRFSAGGSLAGYTLGDVIAHDRSGVLVDLGGTAELVDTEEGDIMYHPAEGDFDADRSPYAVRYRLIDADGRVFHLPRGAPEVWRIWHP
jgi:hypothetical protein